MPCCRASCAALEPSRAARAGAAGKLVAPRHFSSLRESR
ncbi:hypothetical protein MYA_4240 [Burkholderia sp. KJ006]|nr:hypothetical protein MYA_4240 [Burkholderia sp. KJ006]